MRIFNSGYSQVDFAKNWINGFNQGYPRGFINGYGVGVTNGCITTMNILKSCMMANPDKRTNSTHTVEIGNYPEVEWSLGDCDEQVKSAEGKCMYDFKHAKSK